MKERNNGQILTIFTIQSDDVGQFWFIRQLGVVSVRKTEEKKNET